MIDVKIDEINIEMTELAAKQLKLIIENDYTIEDKIFRLKIDGKECHGFTYALGFTDPHQDDLVYRVQGIDIRLDPFTAFYCKQGVIEYLFDMDENREGFYFTNQNENQYRGKFFKNLDKVPPIHESGY